MTKTIPELMLIDLEIDKNAKLPVYLQLYAYFRDMILSGKLRSGQRLPSSRQLAEALKISRNIVSLAYEQLIIEGFLTGVTGSGTFISSQIPDEFLKATGTNLEKEGRGMAVKQEDQEKEWPLQRNQQLEEVKPFQNAVPALDLFPYSIWNKLSARVYRGMDHLHLGYHDARGFADLRESIAGYLRSSRGVKCEAGQIIITSGTQQSLALCAHILLKENKHVAMEDPGYPGARLAFQIYDAKILPIPVEEDGMNIDALIQSETTPKAVYLTPAHQYPMGGTLSISKRIALLNYVSNRDTWIIEDDYDSELIYQGRPQPTLQGMDQYGKVIYMGTFSKVLFPALRVGYLVLPDEQMANHFAFTKAAFDRQSPIAEQQIITSFMEEGHFMRHLRKMRIAYFERQQTLIKAVEKHLDKEITIKKQNAGMHLIGYLNSLKSDKKVAAFLHSKGIIAHPLSEYVMNHTQPPGLLFGYAAFHKFRISAEIQRMALLLSNYKED